MVNTEHMICEKFNQDNYNILNIVVNTELNRPFLGGYFYYNILNIVVSTELYKESIRHLLYYNILNIVVNTEQ